MSSAKYLLSIFTSYVEVFGCCVCFIRSLRSNSKYSTELGGGWQIAERRYFCLVQSISCNIMLELFWILQKHQKLICLLLIIIIYVIITTLFIFKIDESHITVFTSPLTLRENNNSVHYPSNVKFTDTDKTKMDQGYLLLCSADPHCLFPCFNISLDTCSFPSLNHRNHCPKREKC